MGGGGVWGCSLLIYADYGNKAYLTHFTDDLLDNSTHQTMAFHAKFTEIWPHYIKNSQKFYYASYHFNFFLNDMTQDHVISSCLPLNFDGITLHRLHKMHLTYCNLKIHTYCLTGIQLFLKIDQFEISIGQSSDRNVFQLFYK